MTVARATACPCGSGRSYADCCAIYHRGSATPSAADLMRARYSAYALGLSEYLLTTWHPSTRPASLTLPTGKEAPRWLGLQIKRDEAVDAGQARVEFVARYRHGGGRAERLHELSRFLWENSHWFYVDGTFPDDPQQTTK